MRIFFAVLLFWIPSCQTPEPQIVIPDTYCIGESLDFKVIGLEEGETYTLVARKTDTYDRLWSSQATFVADPTGQIDLASQRPVSGSYNQPGIDGLFWSMALSSQPGKDLVAPEPNEFSTVEFTLAQGADTLQRVTTKQCVIPQTIAVKSLEGELVAEILKPKDQDKPLPGIVLLGGSGGGLAWAKRLGALLAKEGYFALALSYFNSENLPEHLAQIPLEYVDGAIDHLLERDDVDTSKIGIIGYSKGSELAILMASRRSEIKSVVAIAPGSAVFQGFKPPKYPVISSWSLNGEDLPFVPNAYDNRFFQTYDGMYLWYRTLRQHEAFAEAAIPVEKINGDILLLSGVKDQIWPATFMAEQIMARLRIADFKYEYEHLAFPNAGHGIAEPPGHPTSGVTQNLGGTAYGNAIARAESWVAIKRMLAKTLGTGDVR